MKAKKLLIATLFTSVAAVAVGAFAFAAPRIESERLRSTGGYECASIHFSMYSDDNHTGTTHPSPTQKTAGTYSFGTEEGDVAAEYDGSLGTVDGITITSYTVSDFVYYGRTSGSASEKKSLKFGKSNPKSGAISYTFEEEVIGITVYICSWNADSGTLLKVNDDDELTATVAKCAAATGSSAATYTFYPYSFTFSAVHTITIAISEGRAFLGDIAIRVAK